MNYIPTKSELDIAIEKIGIEFNSLLGTFRNLITAKPETLGKEILELFDKHKIGAIPILDQNQCIIDIVEKKDLIVFSFLLFIRILH